MKNKFNKLFKLLLQWTKTGKQSIQDFPKSYSLGLYSFEISEGHANDRDYQRFFTYEIGEPKAYQILDQSCYQILKNHKNLIEDNTIFDCVVKIEKFYYNVVIGFKNTHSAYLKTTIHITKGKYEYLKTLKYRKDKDGNINYIVKLHDF